MRELSDSFVSSTFWSDRVGPVAALATLNKMEKIQSWKILDDLSSYMRKCMSQITKSEFMNFNNEGIKPNSSFSFKNRIYEKLFINLMLSSNILSSSRCYLSIKHKKNILTNLLTILNTSTKSLKIKFTKNIMKSCANCLLPETHETITFEEFTCNICTNSKKRRNCWLKDRKSQLII